MKKYIFFSILFFALATQSQASESVSRLYIPSSAQTTILKENGEQKILVKDYLNSTRALEGTTQESQRYFPYGDDSETESLKGTDRQFTGHRKLEETGVYHAGTRFYSPQLGQFIQADKVEGGNRYKYANNSPVIFTDTTGNYPNSNYTIFEPGNSFSFPNNLTLVDPNYTSRFSDPALDKLASTYISRNPFDPETQKYEFVEYLMSDIHDSVPYAPDVVGPGRKYGQTLKELQKNYNSIESMNPRELGDSLSEGVRNKIAAKNQVALAINSHQATKYFVDKQVKAANNEYNSLNLAQRIGQGNAMCWDFCDFTGYTLAKVGIASAIGGTSEFHHAFGLVDIDGTAYMFDTTWDYMETFYNDRTGNNETGRAYNSFGFQTPWGNPFTMNLHHETRSPHPQNVREDNKPIFGPQESSSQYQMY